jgi:hypothetical protein
MGYETKCETIFLVGMIGKTMITSRRLRSDISIGLRYRSLLGPCWLRNRSHHIVTPEHAYLRRLDKLPDDPLVVSLPRQCVYRVMKAIDKLQIQVDINCKRKVISIHRTTHVDYYSSNANARLIQASFVLHLHGSLLLNALIPVR